MNVEKTTKPQPPKPKKSLKKWVKEHLLAIVLITLSIVVAAVFIVAIKSVHYDASISQMNTKKKPEPAKKYYSALTGMEVENEAATKQAVTGVMIENSPAARPQSGLKQAGVVYEAVAEGGITRFMVLYQGNKPGTIGPVRSLRLYYLSWAAPYQASIAHVGGSGNALAHVRNGNYRDIDQFFNAGAYWRSTDRYAPHNVYTSGEKLDQLNNSKNYATSNFTSFARSDEKAVDTPNATSISVNFSSPLYATSYAYDKASNSYLRSLAGSPHNDREAGQITPKTIVVLEAGTELRANNADGYEDIITTGKGKAYIFQNGTVAEAIWQKDNFDSPLKLRSGEGKDIPLNRGQTWIATFTPGRGSVSWQ